MFISILVGFVLLVIAIGACITSYIAIEDCKSLFIKLVCLIIAIVSALSFIAVPFSIRTIDSGEVAVVKRFGKIIDVRDAGINFDWWMTTSYKKYDTKVRTLDLNAASYSADAQPMDITMTLQYQIMVDNVIDIATQYGTLSTLENRITSIAIEKTKSVLSSYKAMDIIANRASISPIVEETIKEAIGDEYHVNVITVVLTNIDFSDSFEIAVEEKMIAEQTKLKADYENQTKIAQAEADAEARVKAAEAEIEIAKAQAEAKKISADAEAEANRIINESLTDKIIDKIIADAWNGELPAVVGNGDYILPSEVLG